MSVSEMVTTIAGGGCGILIVLLSLIQISPIKWNPWSSILKKIGKMMNEDLSTKVTKLEEGLTTLQKSCDEKAMNDCRTRILRFNDEILHKQRHSKEHFDQIITDISDYESYCTKHPDFKNNIAKLAIKNVEATYTKCLNENSFL